MAKWNQFWEVTYIRNGDKTKQWCFHGNDGLSLAQTINDCITLNSWDGTPIKVLKSKSKLMEFAPCNAFYYEVKDRPKDIEKNWRSILQKMIDERKTEVKK